MSSENQTRVQIRISAEEKAELFEAARRSGFKTLSEFMRVSAHEKAQRNLKEFPESSYSGYQTPVEPTQLSEADATLILKSILSPKEPNDALKALFSKSNEEILEELLAQKKKSF